MSRRSHLPRCLAAALAIVLAGVRPTAAQDCGGITPGAGSRCPELPRASREQRYAVTVGANLALGGLTGGIGEGLRGGSFWRGFARGAAGGGLVFAGKQVSAARFTGAGLLGRQVAAVGGSVVNNAAAGRPMLSRVILPVGPVRVYAQPGAEQPLRVKLDAAGVVGLVYAATLPDSRFDPVESLSSGAPVFRVSDDWGARAGHLGGVIITTEHYLAREERFALAHERVHVAQYDFAFAAWSQPAEAWAAEHDSILGGIHRYVDLSANAALFGALNFVIPRRQSPWEREAYLLSATDLVPPGAGHIQQR